MKPKIAEIVTPVDWKLLNDITHVLESLPPLLDKPAYILGQRLPREIATSQFIPNCHGVAWALAKFFPVIPHDGMLIESRPFAKDHLMKHSWLTRKGGDERIIFDVWPLGVVSGPVIAIQDYAYHYGNEQCYLEHREQQFKMDVAITRLAIRKVLKRNTLHLQAAA